MCKIKCLLILLCSLSSFILRANPIYEATVKDTSQLLKECMPFLSLEESDLLALIPPQGGFYFSGSPLTNQGAQENNITWELGMGTQVKCKYTGVLLPNEQYPDNAFIDVITPTNKVQRFWFHETKEGEKYFFEARRWYEQLILLEKTSYALAQLYACDPVKYQKAGRYAVAILKRFAEVYPDYVIRYDYPGHDKKFIDAQAYEKAKQSIDHYFIRLTKWNWWGYSNVSRNLLLTYDLLKGSKSILSMDDHQQITGLFTQMLDFVDPFYEVPITNMHPTFWETQVIASKILNKPELEEKVIEGLENILSEQFTFDGFYKEASLSYHNQTVAGLQRIIRRMYPNLSVDDLNAIVLDKYPKLQRVFRTHEDFKLPNKRYVGINDTWSLQEYHGAKRSVTTPFLKAGMGHALLGSGEKQDQFQAHLNFSGNNGHDHYDVLGLILFAKEKELLSDLGYTHTRARTWTNSTAAHNVVVVDGVSQSAGTKPRRNLGNVVLYQSEHPDFQVVEVKANDVYSGIAKDYRRTLVAVQLSESDNYLVDLFQIQGGETHDWFLHGSADENQYIEVKTVANQSVDFQTTTSLFSLANDFKELKEQGNYQLTWQKNWAYGHFKETKQSQINETVKVNFMYASPAIEGLQTWLLGSPSLQTIATAKAWNVRGAKEEQEQLDNHLRQAFVARRNGPSNQFVAVHVPYKGRHPVQLVKQLEVDETTILIEIVHDFGKDYIYYSKNSQKRTLLLEGKNIVFEGKISLVQFNNDRSKVRMRTIKESPLLELDGIGNENTLVVEGNMAIKRGQVVRIMHGDGQTTSYQILESKQHSGHTILKTMEPILLKLDDNDLLKWKSFPFLEMKGPHYIATDQVVELSIE